jgi:hypothetical protein
MFLFSLSPKHANLSRFRMHASSFAINRINVHSRSLCFLAASNLHALVLSRCRRTSSAAPAFCSSALRPAPPTYVPCTLRGHVLYLQTPIYVCR